MKGVWVKEMNRTEFMQKLSELLNDIPESEKQEALNFYNDYFDEAGVEKEPAVIEELGSPEKVARIIIDGLSGKEDDSNMEYSERGYSDRRFISREELSRRTDTKYNRGSKEERRGKKTDGTNVLLIVILCLLLLPIGAPLAIAALAVIFAVFVTILALAFGLGITGVAIFVTGIILVCVGFVKLFAAPLAAMCLLGGGFLLVGLSILGLLLVLFIITVVFPAVAKGCAWLFRKMFPKRRTVS
ncbi:DUF1700 domain-containing protein [bacterium C-53]|nr:DUF1700 domain-containing protein [Lachnospiraceae bacterium]NBI03745.1 DUF1700 domain-containing protein [Lachnospiraceae bacterium]RKJ09296.1 DUF1700 domain-containing protein [bacterium C-53]